DEMATQEDVRSLMKLVFQLGQGKNKGRQQRNLQLAPIETWATVMVAAMNHSAISIAAENAKNSAAGVYRIFEINVLPRIGDEGFNDKSERLMGEIYTNFGHQGLCISQWLGTNAGSLPDRVQSLREFIVKDLGATDRERFWVAAITVVIMAAKVANQLN